MAVPFEVLPYDIGTLRRLLAEKAHASQAVIDRKTHSEYFESYFKRLDAKTIIVENDYIDRDFLEDFAAYYVRCFHDYARKCTRLHFFSHAFSEAEFAGLPVHPSATIAPTQFIPNALNAAALGSP